MLDRGLEKWLEELEEKLMSGELEEEIKREEKIKRERLDIRYSDTKLLYLVIDKSYPANGFSGLEECKINVITMINDILTKWKQAEHIQIAITDFGSSLNMLPFAYRKSIDISDYIPNQTKSRVYDAVVESILNICYQYDQLESECKVNGFMIIFTDGEDNGSTCTLQDMQDAIIELKKRKIVYFPVMYNGANSKHLENIFECEPAVINDSCKLRQLLHFVSERIPY